MQYAVVDGERHEAAPHGALVPPAGGDGCKVRASHCAHWAHAARRNCDRGGRTKRLGIANGGSVFPKSAERSRMLLMMERLI